jgi:hypothetical protein
MLHRKRNKQIKKKILLSKGRDPLSKELIIKRVQERVQEREKI